MSKYNTEGPTIKVLYFHFYEGKHIKYPNGAKVFCIVTNVECGMMGKERIYLHMN